MRLAFMAAGLATALVSIPVSALTIGDIEIKSSYGQRFSARIPLTLQAGEDIAQGCVRLDQPEGKNVGVPLLTGYALSLEPVSAGKSAVLLTTSAALTEPTVRIPLVIRCGQKTSSSREFIVNQNLVDTKKK